MADPFVHLHVHTEYSFLDGAVRVEAALKKAAALGMPALAITDHGNMHGAIEFYQKARELGVKPIIGCEVYMAPGSMTDRTAGNGREAAFHLTLLSRDLQGYRNLVKLVSAAHLEGQYYKPRIDKELLAKHAAGLVALSGCLKGEINSQLQAGRAERAKELVATYRDIMGRENFFLELQDHGIEAQRRCNGALMHFAREFGLGLVAANDVHFLERAHHDAHDVMLCIGTNAQVQDENRLRYSPELYFKTPEEMAALFGEVPEALRNTLAIAEGCNLELEFGGSHYPEFAPPEGFTREGYLRHLCEEGLRARYGPRAESEPALRERMEYELGLLERMGFTSYFLIVWDFIHYAKTRGIPVGPGRGSAAGSLVAYLLEITDVDPIQFGLLFERFLNPERISPPDIDIDFCQTRRGEVIEYVRRKYGERAVSQIVTFNTMKAKSALRDVNRVLGLGYSEGDRLAKMIPPDLNITLEGYTDKEGKFKEGAIDKNPDLKKAVETEPRTRQIWQYATLLEGLSRNTGVHAAGVVIGAGDLSDIIPLCRGANNEVITQYEMGPLTDLGLLKMDFLGLKNLTVIEDASQLIRRREPDFDLAKIPLDNQPAFDLLNRGETIGVFQMESGGMTAYARQFDIQSIGDIIALISLYRPGPMEMIPDYIDRKKGRKKIVYEHPLLEQVCADTYGVMIYQEQVQRAAAVLAGYSLGQADLLRRAMGKKDKEKMAKERVRFIEGCQQHNRIPKEKADAIFNLLEKFAGYGFNKSHSAAYGIIAYRTAYLKANYPVEFLCGLLGNELDNTDKISVFVEECRRMGIAIRPPDVNRSGLKFLPETGAEGPGIRYGLAAVKNVGEAAVEHLMAERERGGDFKSLEDFCLRVDPRSVNRRALESLIRCGAFDFTGRDRAEMFAAIEALLAASASRQRDRNAGQVSLFGDEEFTPPTPAAQAAVSYEPWTRMEKLGYEKELLGFYVTGHPLDDYRPQLESGRYLPVGQISAEHNRQTVTVAGLLAAVERKTTKKDNRPFAILRLEDFSGSVEVTCWSEAYAAAKDRLLEGAVVAVKGRCSAGDDRIRVSADEVKTLRPSAAGEPLRLVLDLAKAGREDLLRIRGAAARHPGRHPLLLDFRRGGEPAVCIRADDRYSVEPAEDLLRELEPWLDRGK